MDSSKRAIADAKEYVNSEIQKLKDAGKPGLTGRVDLFVGDFFKDDWVQSLGLSITGGFDIIYDYTVNLFFFFSPSTSFHLYIKADY